MPICHRCGRDRKTPARGLCRSCYTYYYRKGIIAGKGVGVNARWTRYTVAELAVLKRMRADGRIAKEIAPYLPGRSIDSVRSTAVFYGYAFARDVRRERKELEWSIARQLATMPEDREEYGHGSKKDKQRKFTRQKGAAKVPGILRHMRDTGRTSGMTKPLGERRD